MANVYAVKTGNWSDTTVWNTGALPTSADDVFANNFTVTVDINFSVKSLRTFGAYAGGIFAVSSSRTLTATDGFYIGSYGFQIALAIGRTVNLIGNISTNSGNGRAAYISGTGGTINITGNITSSNHSGVMFDGNNNTINITGNLYGSSGSYGMALDLQNFVNYVYVTGNLYAGYNSNAPAIANIQSGSIVYHTGSCYAQDGVPALTAGTSVTMTLTGPFYASTNGTHAVSCPVWKWPNASPSASFYQIKSADLTTIRPLYTADSVGGNPATSNVRAGIAYGPVGELTGTCAVPNANSVAYGVPVDNTTGTAVLTATAVKDACSKAVVPALLALG